MDAIDEPGPHGKQVIFEGILRACHLDPCEVLVVGDNPESELGIGRRLGMRTVQTLRPGVPYSDLETWHIHSLFELKTVIEGVGRTAQNSQGNNHGGNIINMDRQDKKDGNGNGEKGDSADDGRTRI